LITIDRLLIACAVVPHHAESSKKKSADKLNKEFDLYEVSSMLYVCV
jgi:hypothetical protein